MRLEQIPILLGVLVAIVGLGLILDAQLPDGFTPGRERRRRQRAERNRVGESLVGLGVLALAAALIGTDRWRYGTIAVLVGAALVGAGAWMNREYLRELLVFRGPARRGEKRADPARRADASGSGVGAAGLADVAAPRGASARAPAPNAPPNGEGGRTSATGRAARPAPDREAPIRVASEGVRHDDGGAGGEDGSDEAPRLRIR